MRSTFVIRLAVLLSLGGCSILLTRGPGHDPVTATAGQPAPPPPSCTTSMTWPTVDGVFAAVLTIALISSISQDNNSMTSDDPDGDAIASGFILAGAAGVGALIGHSRVSKCRRATETYQTSFYGQQQQPYGYAQPQPQYYPQQYPPQYPAQGYPAPQQYPTQPQPQYTPVQPAAPVVVGPPPPSRQPAPPVAKQPPPVARTPAPKAPKPKAPDPVLGTEGDVCTSQSECANGFACTGNVCLKAR